MRPGGVFKGPACRGQVIRNRAELQRCRAAIRQGGPNALVKLPGSRGFAPASERLKVLEKRIDQVSTAKRVEIPEMIEHPELPFRVMKGVVVEKSLLDGRELAKHYGGKYRVPTEQELLKLNKLLGDQLDGTGYWVWTETEHESYPGRFVLRHLSFDDIRTDFIPGSSFSESAVRLVEDK